MATYYRVKISNDDNPQNPRTDWDNVGTMLCWHRRHCLGDYQDKRRGAKGNPKCEHQREDVGETLLHMIAEFDSEFESRLDNDWWNYHEKKRGIDKLSGDAYFKARGELSKDREALIQRKVEKYYVILPLYLYEHSGMTMNTSGFSCPWDSGQVGFIYVSRKAAKAEYGYPELKEPGWSAAMEQRCIEALKSEVKVYDQFLQGDVYGFVVEKLVYEFEQPVIEEVDPEDDDLPWKDADSCWGFFGDDVEESGMIEHSKAFLLPAFKEAQSNIDTWVLFKHEPVEETAPT